MSVAGRACSWRWRLAGVCLLVLVVLPYVLGETLMELELIVAQPVLRLVLLLASGVVAALALRHAPARCATPAMLAALALLVESIRLAGLSFVAAPVPDTALRVYTQNVGMAAPETMSDWLAAEQPDLVLLQEVYTPDLPRWEELAARLGYHAVSRELRGDAGMGGLILSKMPLTPLSPVHGPTAGGRSRYFTRARVAFQGRRIEILSVHLESLPIDSGVRHLFGSSGYRFHQAKLLAYALPPRPAPVILGGDLNATSLYRSTRPLRRVLGDTWPQGGLGLGCTYPAVFPLARIDAILQRGFRTLSCRVVRLGSSDHRGLYAVLILDGDGTDAAP